MKKAFSRIILSIGSAYLIFFGIRAFITPNYPQEWDEVEVGMKQSEVHKNIPTIDKNWIEVKGFEQDDKDYGNSYWNLAIYYDKNKNVSRIVKRYVYRSLGLWNRNIIDE